MVKFLYSFILRKNIFFNEMLAFREPLIHSHEAPKFPTVKIRELLWIMVLMVILTACEEKKEPKLIPDFSEEKMVLVLKDIHLAEAAVQQERTNTKDSLLTIYYDYIYEIHDITKEDLERNMEAWFGDAEATDKLYQKVIESLSIDEANYGKGKDEEPPKKPKVLETVNGELPKARDKRQTKTGKPEPKDARRQRVDSLRKYGRQ